MIASAQIAVTKTVGSGSESSPSATATCVALTQAKTIPITVAQPIALCWFMTLYFGVGSGGSTVQCSPAVGSCWPAAVTPAAMGASAAWLVSIGTATAVGTTDAVGGGAASTESSTSPTRSVAGGADIGGCSCCGSGGGGCCGCCGCCG